jgi:ABC-type multidrug transport system fused ATPase/permease subunit
LLALVGLGGVGFLILRINRRTHAVSKNVPKEQATLSEGIERVARNLLLVRALRTESDEHRRFTRSIVAYARHSTMAHTLSALATSLTPLLALLLLVVIIIVSQGVLHTPGLALLSFLYLFIRFAQTLAQMVQSLSQTTAYLPQLRIAMTYLGGFTQAEVALATGDVGAERPKDRQQQEAAVERTDPLGPRLHLAEVAYAYPGATREILQNLSATIDPGSQIGVVGPSGAGKSTLLAIVLGLLKPTRGTISIDGRPPERFFADPAIRVGYVGAEPFLIAGTILDNLSYGLVRKIDDAEIDLALDRARLKSVVDQLPGRLSYAIGEDGSGLSAGQKQRLCLARAILNRPHVLVLDEVSANLDVATESEIAESLKALRGRCTTIIVSHRAELLKYADHTLKLGATPDTDTSGPTQSLPAVRPAERQDPALSGTDG